MNIRKILNLVLHRDRSKLNPAWSGETTDKRFFVDISFNCYIHKRTNFGTDCGSALSLDGLSVFPTVLSVGNGVQNDRIMPAGKCVFWYLNHNIKLADLIGCERCLCWRNSHPRCQTPPEWSGFLLGNWNGRFAICADHVIGA